MTSPTAVATPDQAPTPTVTVGWLAYGGQGFWISYPPEWDVRTRQESPAGIQVVSPTDYPFLDVQNRGPAGSVTTEILAQAQLIDIRENLGSPDAADSPTVLDGDDAVMIRYHNTGDTGIEYYSVKVVQVHDGTMYEVTLYSKAGREADTDRLLSQFVDAFTVQGASETAIAKLVCTTPAGWELTASRDGTARRGPEEGIIVEAGPKGEDTLASWNAKSLAVLKKLGPTTVVSDVASSVADADSRRLTMTVAMDSGSSLWISEGFFHDDLGYDVVWTSPVGDETTDVAAFQRVIDSCRFTH